LVEVLLSKILLIFEKSFCDNDLKGVTCLYVFMLEPLSFLGTELKVRDKTQGIDLDRSPQAWASFA
jgi:hypothetical protein